MSSKPYRCICQDCHVSYIVTREETPTNCRYCGAVGIWSEEVERGADETIETALKQVLHGKVEAAVVHTMPDPKHWRAWLNALHEALYQRHMDPRTRRPWYDTLRRMTADEWLQLQHIIREHELICSMRNANMGFGCGMTIYEPGEPVYPGVPIKPTILCDVTKDHLPLPVGKDRTSFDDGWEAFSPFTHNDDNTARLKAEGLPEPKGKSHYDY